MGQKLAAIGELNSFWLANELNMIFQLYSASQMQYIYSVALHNIHTKNAHQSAHTSSMILAFKKRSTKTRRMG